VSFKTFKSLVVLVGLAVVVSGCAFTRDYIYDPNMDDGADVAEVDSTADREDRPRRKKETVELPPPPPELPEKRLVRPGVMIAPLQGAPLVTGRQLSADIARALRSRDVRASFRSTDKIAYMLEGQAHLSPAQRGGADFRIDWNLVAPDGLSAGRFSDRVPVTGSNWKAVTDRVLAPMAARAATQVDILMADHIRAPEAVPIAEVASQEIAEGLREVMVLRLLTPVFVALVDGAPGDGDIALKNALSDALLKARVPVARTPSDEAFMVLGDVHEVPIDNDSSLYEFTWMVMRNDGSLIGTASDEMTIGRDRIRPIWGTVAITAIDKIVGDIVAVIDKASEPEANG
jgi:hypothetical protein